MADNSTVNTVSDVLFNTVSLKRTLEANQICANCEISTKDWMVISVCHHKICQMCIDAHVDVVATNSIAKHCPKCNVLYRPTNLTNNEDIKAVVTEIEEFVWSIQANMYGFLEENFYADRVPIPNIVSVKPTLHENICQQIKSTESLKNSKGQTLKNKKGKRGEHFNGLDSHTKKNNEVIKKIFGRRKLKNITPLSRTVTSQHIKSSKSLKNSVSQTLNNKKGKRSKLSNGFSSPSKKEKELAKQTYDDAKQIQEDTESLLDDMSSYNNFVSSLPLEDNMNNEISSITSTVKNKKRHSNKNHSNKFDSSLKKMAKPKKIATSSCKDIPRHIKSTIPLKDSVSRTLKNKKGKQSEQSNVFSSPSRKEKELAKLTYDDAKQIQEVIESLLDNVSSYISPVSSVSHEDNLSNEITAITSTKSNKANDKYDVSNADVIYGKPKKLSPNITYIKDCRLIVAISNITPGDLAIYEKWAVLFDICTLDIKSKWDQHITHLIVKTNKKNMCMTRTFKFLNALLSGSSIISFDWVLQCMNLGTLVPEFDYMVNDSSGVPSPKNFWLSNHDLSTSPMQWAQDCILYFHKTAKLDMGYANSRTWATQAGFTLVHKLSEFKNKKSSKIRVILIDIPGPDHAHIPMPEESYILKCLVEYKAITIYIDWYFECLFRFKFVYFEKDYQVIPLSREMLKHTGMADSLFKLSD